MPEHQQTSFAGGEIAPELYARRDLDRYRQSFRSGKNFIVTREGALMNRPGTKFIREVKDSAKKVRLVPFRFSSDQTYVLEFGESYVRFIKNGAYLGAPYEVVTTYTEAELPYLKFAQVGDTLYIAHQSHVPAKLVRSGDTSWALSDLSFLLLTGVITNPAYTADGGSQHWTWLIRAVVDGREIGSIATTDTGTGSAPVTVSWDAFPSADSYNIYRSPGANEDWGFVGSSNANSFYDMFSAPAYDIKPQQWRYPFASLEYPAVVALYEQRLVFANTLSKPNGVWLSETGDFVHMTASSDLVPRDDEALNFELGSLQFEEIRSLLPQRVLMALTHGAHWALSGANGGPITPLSIEARPQFYAGVSWLDPIPVGSSYLAVQERGNIVHDVAYSQEYAGVNGADLTVMARHLFKGYSIVDWAFAREPFSAVWVVRSDGALLSLAYLKEQDVWAWAQHDVNGTVERVCSVAEGSEDAVYIVVQRTIDGSTKRYIERMTTRQISDVRLGCFLDCSSSTDGRNTGAETMSVDNETGWTAGESLDVSRSVGTFVAGDVGKTVVFYPDTENVRVRITSYISGTKMRGEVLDLIPEALRSGSATTDWGIGLKTVTGLSHLEAQSVYALGDGAVQGPYTVASGSITLDAESVVVHAGLRYDADLELLDLAIQGRAQPKNVHKVNFEVAASRGLWAGESLPAEGLTTDLREWKQRPVGEDYQSAVALETTLVEVRIKQTWNKGGRAVLRQWDPLPITVLSAIREYEVGGS